MLNHCGGFFHLGLRRSGVAARVLAKPDERDNRGRQNHCNANETAERPTNKEAADVAGARLDRDRQRATEVPAVGGFFDRSSA